MPTVVWLLAWVVGRPEWGRAMVAEVEQISGPAARRRFAWGCLRALAFIISAVDGCVFATAVVSVGVVVAALILYPGMVAGVGAWLAVGFIIVVAGYAVAAARLTPFCPAKSTGEALVAGAAIAGSWMWGLTASAAPPGVSMFAVGAAIAIVSGWRATRRSSSAPVGLRCAGLAALVAGLGLFVLWGGQTVLFGGRPYDAGMVRDFRSSAAPDLATYAVSDSLGSGMMLLLLVSLVSLLAGAIGTTAVTHRPRRADLDS